VSAIARHRFNKLRLGHDDAHTLNARCRMPGAERQALNCAECQLLSDLET
jgi:hypothetical protein